MNDEISQHINKLLSYKGNCRFRILRYVLLDNLNVHWDEWAEVPFSNGSHERVNNFKMIGDVGFIMSTTSGENIEILYKNITSIIIVNGFYNIRVENIDTYNYMIRHEDY